MGPTSAPESPVNGFGSGVRDFRPRITPPEIGEAAKADLVPSLRPKPSLSANQAGLRSNFDHPVYKSRVSGVFRELGAIPSTVIAIAVRNPQLFL
jgi:hypothetical protein